MRRLSLLGLGVLAVIAALAVMAATALAVPVQPLNLPEKLPRTFTGESESPTVYHGGLGNITCQKAVSEGEALNKEEKNKPPSGVGHIMFTECKGPLGEACTGLGEAKEVILVLVDWELIFDRETGGTFSGLTVATLFTILGEVHFTCGIVLVKTKGETLCLDLLPTEESTVHLYHCTGKTATEPADEWCMEGEENNVCVGLWLAPKLEASENGSPFKPALELALAKVTSPEPIFADI